MQHCVFLYPFHPVKVRVESLASSSEVLVDILDTLGLTVIESRGNSSF